MRPRVSQAVALLRRKADIFSGSLMHRGITDQPELEGSRNEVHVLPVTCMVTLETKCLAAGVLLENTNLHMV